MKLHEHQAKTIFADAGIPVPDSRLATTVDEALDAVDEIGYPAAIKAQVHVGGRGKAGGIKIATDRDEAEQYAEEILGMDLKGTPSIRSSSNRASTSSTNCTSASRWTGARDSRF